MLQRLLASAAVGAFLFAGVASADDGWGRRGHGWDRGYDSRSYDSRWDRGRRDYRHHDDDDDNDAALLIGGAIVGLAVGALIASSNDSGGAQYGGQYNDPGYGYGYAEPSYSYASPPPSYSYATPAPAPTYGGYTSPNTGVTYANMGVPCRQAREGRTATGAVIGGVIGGLIGNGVAADGVRGEGTAVGAVLGSTIGGSIGNSTAECGGAPATGYQQTGYTYQEYNTAPYSESYGGLGSNEPYTEEYRWEDDLYGGPSSEPSYSGPAAEECERVMRVTTLPDGREIHEPIEVCREAHYGEWSPRN